MKLDFNLIRSQKAGRAALTAAVLGGSLVMIGVGLAAEPKDPLAVQTVVRPNDLSSESHWKHYRDLHPAPSVDQRLTDPILMGAIDLHAHFGPDSYGRQWDSFEIARVSAARGMRGLVFKNHWSEAAGMAYLVKKYAGLPQGFEVFGGLALNAPEGGINPQAVRYFGEIEGGLGKIVWFPSHDSEHEVKAGNEHRYYVRVSENGKLLPPVFEVLDLIKKYNMTLATGHITPKETLMLVAAAKERGIEHIILTHPGLGPVFTDPTIDELKQMVAMGGKAEFVAIELLGKDAAKNIERIKTLGVANCFVSTDSGLVGTPVHPDALVLAIRVLRKAGFSESDLDILFRKNPGHLIGLPD